MRRTTKIQLALLDNLVWVMVAVFFIVNAVFTPQFLSSRNLLNILFQSATLGLMVLGQGIVMMVGELDLSMEATLGFAPGIAILLGNAFGLPAVICVILTLVIGAAVGWFNGTCLVKLQTNSFLLTMSTQIVMRGLVLFLVPFSLAKLDPFYTWLGRGRIGALQVAVLALAILGGCSFNGGMGKPVGMLGGTLLLGMLDNALTLNGVDVNLVSATKGALIFLAILLDHLRHRLTAWIMHRENVRRLMRSSGRGASSSGQTEDKAGSGQKQST